MALKFAVVTVKYRYDLWGGGIFFDQEYISKHFVHFPFCLIVL